MWFSLANAYAKRGISAEHKKSRMILWAVIVALFMNSVLGNATVNYDTTPTDRSNPRPLDDTSNEASTGFGDALPVASALNPEAADSANASSSAGYLITSTTASSLHSNCVSQGKFYCQSEGTCIDSSWRCDGYGDCLYNEDELGCTPRTSTSDPTTSSARDSCIRQGRFYCQSGETCISSSWRCDGYNDCLYSEDELGCPTITSTPRSTDASSSCGGTRYGSGYVHSPYFSSPYGNSLRCNWTLVASPYNGYIVLQFISLYILSVDIVSIYNSNGSLIDQYSGSSYPDTMFLDHTAFIVFNTVNYTVYSAYTGFSLSFNTSVLSPRERCEGQGNFYCALSYNCVDMSTRCSGYNSCKYGEDEAGCSTSTLATTIATTTTLSPRASCEQQGYFYCGLSNLCIASWRRCDGYTYCYYGEDESGCSSSSTTRTPEVTTSSRDSCLGQGNFYCEFSRECIAMWRRCDGHAYCYYGEDESGCSSTTATSRPVSNRPSASDRPQGSFIAASGVAQAFLQLGKSSASALPRGKWILVSGYVTALFLGISHFRQ